ncbi:nucleotide exchange factor GrpE [Chloroflexales bacterium ZM16-3]|nr:nucleotide exchange factor GrpE [Chloroflexales bacterium ZM16-3]
MSQEHMNSQPASNGQPATEVVDDAPEATIDTEVAALEARLAQAESQAAEYKNQWLRATADYKNFKRRADAERSELIRSAGASLLLKLLPVVDDFDRAIANIPAEIVETPWWGGTQLIAQKLRILLESEGVKSIETLGQDFDPNVHEAVLYEDAEGQDGKVIAELQRGYKLHERVLRPAMVKVGRG